MADRAPSTHEEAERIANLARSVVLGGKILRLSLSSGDGGRFAKIYLKDFVNQEIAAIARLSDESIPPEMMLSYALAWFWELQEQKSLPPKKLWLICDPAMAQRLLSLTSLFCHEWQKKIRVWEVSGQRISPPVEAKIGPPAPPRFSRIKKPSLEAAWISGFSPENISLLRAGNSEYLHFRGLRFARIFRGNIFFGIEKQKNLLDSKNGPEFMALIESLRKYRSHDSPNKRNSHYSLDPEAWLESIFRQNISKLDADLILSPVYNQFRSSDERIDLLALRKDGRLVIVELKVSPYPGHLFQALGYWQEIERQRIAGHLKKCFEGARIADAPAIICLAAPASAYHPLLSAMASLIDPQIEIHRIELHENWREDARVLSRGIIGRPA